MSLNSQSKLFPIAVDLAKQLRKNSTEAEIILWKTLKAKKFLNRKFLRQHPIFYDISGRESFFIAYFYCHECKLVIELDGKWHLYRLKEDFERTEILNYLGLKVIRFSNEEIISSLNHVIKKIEKEISW